MADGMHAVERLDARQIAEATGGSKRGVEVRARRELWPYEEVPVRGGLKRLYRLADLPAEVQAAVLLRHHRAQPIEARMPEAQRWDDARRESLWDRYARAGEHLCSVATRRHRALLAVEALTRNGMGLMAARVQVVAQLQREGIRGASVASLCRWAAEVEGAPRDCWLPLLLPAYCGRTKTAEMPAEAWDIFKADYLRPSRPSAAGCYERLQRIARERGWTLPSLKTFERRLQRELPRPALILARQGEEVLLRTYPAQERDHTVFHALEAVNADGHKFDLFVRFPHGAIGRPIMVAFQDIYSGKVLSWRVGETENADLVRLAAADMIRTYGIPSHAWLDNGRGFASKFISGGTRTRYRFRVKSEDPTGVLVAMGIEIHWATPYHGQAKPIERAFRDLCDRVAKHPAFEGAYTGHRPDAKPENYGSRAVPWDEFLRVLRDEIAAHNARTGRKSKVCAGRSFDAAFAESYARGTIRRATTEQLRQMLLASEVVTASTLDGSVHLAGNRYWTEALSAYAGQKVVLRFDPDHLHGSVSVYTLGNQFVADAECLVSIGFADVAAGREHQRARKQYRRAAKQALEAERRMAAAKVAAQLPAIPPTDLPTPAVIEGVFRRPARPAPTAAMRTGTDDTPQNRALDAHLKRIQQRQLEERGWASHDD